MALLFWDGLDSYATTEQFQQRPGINLTRGGSYNAASINTGIGRFGGSALVGGSNVFGDSSGAVNFNSSVAEVWAGKAVYITGTDKLYIYRFGSDITADTNGAFEGFVYTYNGKIYAAVGSNFSGSYTIVGETDYIVSTNTWHWFDIRYKLHATAGEIEVWFNNQRVLLVTGINTKTNASATYIRSISLATSYGATGVATYSSRHDDLYVLDLNGPHNNTRLGDCRMATLVPSSDYGPNDGTPSSGSVHWSAVNDFPGYNTTNSVIIPNTTSAAEIYGHGPLPNTASVIRGVALITNASKTDAGEANVMHTIVTGGSSYYATAVPLAASVGFIRDEWITNPSTGALWSNSQVNSLKFGLTISKS